ncbi:hypothetical protein ALCH109712_15655 [Alkalicoccus chagannorensis]
MGDHTECLEVEYESEIIRLEALLDLFWEQHSGKNHPIRGNQYASLLLYSDEMEKQIMEEKKSEWEEKKGHPIDTRIEPFSGFTTAEDYHQKYMLKRHKRAMKPIYLEMNESDVRDSTLCARLNALAGGWMSMQEIKEEFPSEKLLGQIRW